MNQTRRLHELLLLAGLIIAAAIPRLGVAQDVADIEGDAAVNARLRSLLRDEGLSPREEEGWLVLQEGPSICGDIVRQLEPQEGIINLQLDIYLKLDDERILVESFGGIGDSREEATNDALRTFSRGTLPVLLAGLYGDTSVRVNRLTWEVAGQERRVTIGNLTARGQLPGDGQPPREWIAALKEEIAKADLPGGTHWLRVYVAQLNNELTAAEVLLDNQPWQRAQRSLADLDWPRSRNFYSLRVFLLIQD